MRTKLLGIRFFPAPPGIVFAEKASPFYYRGGPTANAHRLVENFAKFAT